MHIAEYTRIYTDEHGESHFEDVAIPLEDEGMIGYLGASFPVRSLQFRINDSDYDWDFHNAPARQFIILLDGELEITNSKGESRRFSGGDVLLVEDTHGKGHRTRHIRKQIRKSIIIRI